MKKNKILILGCFLLSIAVLTALTFPKEKKDFLILKTMEAHSSYSVPSVMIITKSDGTTQSFDLQPYAKNKEKVIENMKTITSKILEIQSMGYELNSFSGGGASDGYVYTYYFEKK